MNLSGKIYSKTGKGAQALSSKSRALSSDSKKILASIDGKTDAGTLMEQFDKLPDEAFITMIGQLETDGYIRFVKNKDWEFDDDVGASSAIVVDELSPEDFFALTSHAAPEAKSQPTVEPETATPKAIEVNDGPSTPSKSEAEKKARQEAERKAREEAEQLAREEELTRKKVEAEVIAETANAEKLAAERLIREEEEARQKAEAEARLEAERLAREEEAHKQAEAEMRAKAEHKAKLEAERKASEEAERKAREDAERKARQEEARQKAEAEALAKAEKEARLEAERIAKLEAKRQADEKKALRQKARDEKRSIAAELAREQAEQKARDKAERKAREDAERKARQEEEARQKTEAETRARAEKETRLEVERLAREGAKRQADEEKALRQKARDEERAIAAELAREQAEQKAREKAERKAEKEAQRTLRPPLDLSKWLTIAKKVLIYSPLIAILLLGLLHAVNLRMLADPIEARLSEVVGEPVSIREVRISLFPAAHLTLSGIVIGEGDDPDIGLIRMSPMVLMQSDGAINLQTLEIEDVTVSSANVASQMKWLGASTSKNKLTVEEISIKQITLSIPGLELAPLSAQVIVPASGGLDLITLESGDKRMKVSLLPANAGYKVTINANAWQPPASRLQFTELNAEGFADSEQIHFDRIVGRIYSGTLTANLTINWANQSEASGSFVLNELSLPVALSSMGSAASIDGTLNIQGSFSGAADLVGELVDNLAINATFAAVNGKVNGVNLSSQLISGSSRDSATRFDKLTGSVVFKDDHYQYRKLLLDSGQFKAKGNLDIQADQDITGKVFGELVTPSRVIRSNLNLSGKVGNVRVN